MILIDSDILIWYLRGNIKAQNFIQQQNEFSISVVTYLELVQGMKNKHELSLLRKSLRHRNVKILYLDEEISVKAMFLVEQYYLSHSLELADAFIAATALTHGLVLATGNLKHYSSLKDIELLKFKP